MREIKFRAWDKEINEMKEVVFVDHYLRYPKRFEMMQYTGLKDKNGKEIYEGDIVQSANGLITTVEWDDDIDCDRYWRYAVGLMINFEDGGVDVAEPKGIEVIGNIYENPELIGGA